MDDFSLKAINQAIEKSKYNISNNYEKGGPFGTVIVKDGKIIASCHNTVVESKDPTAHAEVNAIRKAGKVLKTHDLEGCILYTSAEPCPMCLSAIIWANIKEVYYANTRKDADEIGFRDDDIYEYLKGKNQKFIKLHQIKDEDALEEALEVFEIFKETDERNMY